MQLRRSAPLGKRLSDLAPDSDTENQADYHDRRNFNGYQRFQGGRLLDNYIDDLRMDSAAAAPELDASSLPTWCAFALGGMVTFLFVYIGIARPAATEIALLRQQMSTLEQSVWEIAGHNNTAASTNKLLGLLNQQQQEAKRARAALEEMRELHSQVVQEAERAESAMVAVSQLASLKDMLLANSERATAASDVLSQAENLLYRLVNDRESTRSAADASGELLALRDDLLNRSGQVEDAKSKLEQLIEIRRKIDENGDGAKEAQLRVSELISLKDTIVARTGNLADAIETLELTTELGLRFREAAESFGEIRHWMVEVVAMEPMFQRARTALEPLIEMSSLRNLSPHQLRALARSVNQQHQAQLAQKPADLEGDSTGFEPDTISRE